MSKRPNERNLLSLLLAVIMLVSMMAQAVYASGGEVIASFAMNVTELTVATGTKKGGLPLPSTLEATLEGGQAVNIPVEWNDDGQYDGDTAGAYTFTADFGINYVYAGAAPYAAVTVKVVELEQEPEPEPEEVPQPEPTVNANAIGGIIWVDKNQDLLIDEGEPRAVGYDVLLTPKWGSIADAILSTTTDGDGAYLFEGIEPGAYSVAVRMDATTEPASSNGIGDNKMMRFKKDKTATHTALMTVASDSVLTDIHGALLPTELWTDEPAPVYENSVGGIVWLDENGDGVMDEGETRLAGYAVKLVSANESKSATTDENGAYGFQNLVPGEWRVQVEATREVLLPAAIQADNGIGTDGQSDALTIEETTAAVLNAGLLPNPDVQEYPNSISGFVWADVTNDGVYVTEPEQPEGALDENGIPVDGIYIEPEYPLIGWQVYLVRADNLDEIIATAETDENGLYAFANIEPGEYRVKPAENETYTVPRIGLLGGNRIEAETGATEVLVVAEDSIIADMDIGMKVKSEFDLLANYNIDVSLATIPNGIGYTGGASSGIAPTGRRCASSAMTQRPPPKTEASEIPAVRRCARWDAEARRPSPRR